MTQRFVIVDLQCIDISNLSDDDDDVISLELIHYYYFGSITSFLFSCGASWELIDYPSEYPKIPFTFKVNFIFFSFFLFFSFQTFNFPLNFRLRLGQRSLPLVVILQVRRGSGWTKFEESLRVSGRFFETKELHERKTKYLCLKKK